MIKIPLACIAILSLAACGGSRYASSNSSSSSANTYSTAGSAVTGGAVLFASGPLQKACITSDRKARSRARCGCVQAVANQSLSGSDQKRGAKYWKNPHALQEVRQSDNAGNERFWKAWKAFGQSAAAQCRGS